MSALTRAEFVEKTQANKIIWIDELAADLYVTGFDLAKVAQEYYALGGRYGKGAEFQKVQGRKAKLEFEHDTLKKVISALQSTLRSERELSGNG